MVLVKVQVDFLGVEQAAALRMRLSEKIAPDVFSTIFPPACVLAQCGNGDFLKAFGEYYIAMQEGMKRAGLEEHEVVEFTEYTLQVNITYCAYHEVAKRLGNAYMCFFSACYGDDVFFPRFAEAGGCIYKRTGTLATGKDYCDMRFERRIKTPVL